MECKEAAMNRRTVLIVLGVMLVIVAGGAAVGFSYVQSLIAPKPLTIRYATVQTLMPEGAACAGDSDESPGVAKEILNLETDYIFVGGGSNGMPDDVWANYTFRLPLFKNSTRNLMFNGSCFFRSPDAPADCEGSSCFTIETINDYTWLKLTQIIGQSCYPDPSGCSSDVVNPGFVSVNTIAKCHRIIYDGPVVYELSDGEGNLFVMHATATGTPDLTPQLPDGWTVTKREISAPLVVLPFGGGEACYYNIVRDNLVQSYHQYAYGQAEYPDS
jgi:hypothetical protein